MKLLSIELHNWGPYRGKHVLDLDVTEEAPVILVHGENMRGKTSLLRAIIWCLYGRMKNQDGRTDLALARLVNRSELVQYGDVEFGVTLHIAHKDDVLELRRYGKAAIGLGTEATITSTRLSLLPRGGHPFAEEHVQEQIDSILNYEISDFFFFDGEMLNRFEERLRDDKSGSQVFVRGQVERALGLPFLKTLEADLDQIRRDIDLDIQKSLRADKKASALIAEYQAALNAERAAKADDQRLRERHTALQEELEERDAQLSSVEDIKELFFERRSLEAEVEANLEEQKRLYVEMKGRHEQNWWFPLAASFEIERGRILSAMAEAQAADHKASQFRISLENAKRRLADKYCPTCHQEIVNFDADAVESEIRTLEMQISALPATSASYDLTRRAQKLEKYSRAGAVVDSILQASKDVRKLTMQMEHRKARIKAIDDSLQNNKLDIAALESQRQATRDNLAKSSEYLRASETLVLKAKAEVKRLSKAIADNPKVGVKDRTRLDYVESALEIVKESFAEFSAQMRMSVEDKATGLFRRLTTEKDYTGVSISPDYSIRILNSSGHPVDLISAGGNQVLTMAFIGALAECSAEDAPMVMDTPFGRLDTGHREAILRWVSEARHQTVMFVQSGEYNESRDRPLLAERIGREYRIERLGEQESRISAFQGLN